MGYKVLLTFDLNDVTSTQRTAFYEKLEELKWSRVGKLTTTWKCSFEEGISRIDATKVVISDLKEAKQHSKMFTKVEYAFQMDEVDIDLGTL